MGILDQLTFPWSNPTAQQLHRTLVDLNPSLQAATFVARTAGVDETMVDLGQPVALVWVSIIDEANRQGLTRALVKAARSRIQATSPGASFLDQVLNDETPPMDGDARAPGASPTFITGDDTIGEKEALLFVDDLTISIGKVPALILTLQRLVELAPAICRLNVDVNGTPMDGSGFRIGPDLLLTNHHVLHLPPELGGARATGVVAEFLFEDDGKGGFRNSVLVPCDVGSIQASEENDWGVIRVAAGETLDAAWPIIDLAGAAEPVVGGSAYIVQHPKGTRKKLGFVRNLISAVDDRTVHYLTDTQGGSSGSPVFDADGRLIALHHVGGTPQEALGKQPFKKNEGVRIPPVVAGIEAAGVQLP